VGAIGGEAARLALHRPNIEVVAAIDNDPGKVGKDLGQVIGLGRNIGATVSYDADAVLRSVEADVVLHATAAHLTAIYPQLAQCVAGRKNVISCAEELVNPWVSQPGIAQRLDDRAREASVALVGSGTSPGFVVDTLSLVMAGTCQDVRSITVSRVADVGGYRLPAQLRLGIGLAMDEFQRRAGQGAVGYVGLASAVYLVAEVLGWRLDQVTETVEAVPAKERRQTAAFTIEKGRVAGVHQVVRGIMGEREVIGVDLQMSLGAKESRDSVVIDGRPPVNVSIAGGINDDQATVGLMVNAVPLIGRARAGLLTLRDLPLVATRRAAARPAEEALL
ncbi:MAG: hypothetical protein ACE5IZ_04015, partial [Dehalococcoidia bacterium]